MKKQICGKKFKLRSPTFSQTELTDIFDNQLKVLKAIADRQGWCGQNYFWPGQTEQLELTLDDPRSVGRTSEEYRQRWIKEYVLCLHSEASELLDMMNWKHWKLEVKPVDWEEAKFEVVDLFIFVLNLALASGMGPYELAQRLTHKMDLNIERQKKGY